VTAVQPSSGGADHDVLRRGPLEEQGVDHGVADQRNSGQRGGQRIGKAQQQHQAERADHQREAQHLTGFQVAARQWPATGAGHQGIYPSVHQVIESGGGTRHQRDAQRAEQQDFPRHHPRCRQQHADYGGEGDQGDDLGFGQFQIIPPVAADAGVQGLNRGGHHAAVSGRSRWLIVTRDNSNNAAPPV
jgi:hypothetical protein